jgi:hypothetical protein
VDTSFIRQQAPFSDAIAGEQASLHRLVLHLILFRITSTNAIIYDHYLVTISCLVIEVHFAVTKKILVIEDYSFYDDIQIWS